MKDRNLLIVMLCLVVIVMSVAFAAFTTKLNINGSASIDSTWKIAFDQDSSSCTGDGNTVSVSESTNATLNISLKNPGDSVTCTLTVKNSGTLDAKLTSIDVTPESNDAPITYTVTPDTGAIATRPTLTKDGGTETIVVTAKYNEEVSTQPDHTSKTVTVRATYVQDLK